MGGRIWGINRQVLFDKKWELDTKTIQKGQKQKLNKKIPES